MPACPWHDETGERAASTRSCYFLTAPWHEGTALIARIVVPGIAHHVTQRGNHRAAIFFEDGDYALYRDLLGAETRRAGVAVWSWCLMPNHVHLILTPSG